MVTASAFVPRRGNAVWIDFTPQAGHEQTGPRPAVVLSPRSCNGKTGMAILCPITNRVKGYPFEVAIPTGKCVTGVMLADQIKNADRRARNATLIAPLPVIVVDAVLERVGTLLAIEEG